MSDSSQAKKDQQHPQWSNDRPIVDALLAGEPTDYNLAELARLRMRYMGFPGARDIQSDLETLMQRWQLTETALYEKTCQLHATGQVYKNRKPEKEDWS